MRIQPILAKDAPISIRSYFQNGEPSELVASLAQVPELLDKAMPFIGQILSPSAIDLRTKELVILRVSVWQNCQYCRDTHTSIAYRSGFLYEELTSLRRKEEIQTIFSAKEQQLIAWVDRLSQTGKSIPTTEMEHLKSCYTESEIVELTLLVGAVIMLNRYCTALGISVSEKDSQLVGRLFS